MAVVSAGLPGGGFGDMDVAKKPPWMGSRRPPPGRPALAAAPPEAVGFSRPPRLGAEEVDLVAQGAGSVRGGFGVVVAARRVEDRAR